MYGTQEDAIRGNVDLEFDDEEENLAYRTARDTSSFEEKVGPLAAAEAKYIEREVPSIASLSYEQDTGTFRDDRGEVVYPDAIGDRLTEIHSGDKAAGRTSSVGRVGKASGRRYLATKAIMAEGTLGLELGRGLYQKSLDSVMDSSSDTSRAEDEAQNPDTLDQDDVRLKYHLVSSALRNDYPELWSLVPPELKPGIHKGKPEAWAELLATHPELFRKQPFRGMEDLAWEHLMRRERGNSNNEPGRMLPIPDPL
jgi:hypothetical protein